MARVLKAKPECEGMACRFVRANVIIDPRLFAINQIKQVPALIFVETMPPTAAATAVVYGDASLKGMVVELFRLSKNQRVKGLVRGL